MKTLSIDEFFSEVGPLLTSAHFGEITYININGEMHLKPGKEVCGLALDHLNKKSRFDIIEVVTSVAKYDLKHSSENLIFVFDTTLAAGRDLEAPGDWAGDLLIYLEKARAETVAQIHKTPGLLEAVKDIGIKAHIALKQMINSSPLDDTFTVVVDNSEFEAPKSSSEYSHANFTGQRIISLAEAVVAVLTTDEMRVAIRSHGVYEFTYVVNKSNLAIAQSYARLNDREKQNAEPRNYNQYR